MNPDAMNSGSNGTTSFGNSCESVRADFSSYLDGAVSGLAMASIARHLQECQECAAEFSAWRAIQRSLGELGQAQPPARLQANLRMAIAAERLRGTYLSLPRRFARAWESSIAPAAGRFAGGLAAAVVVLGCLSWMFATPLAVQANDDNLAHLIGPRFLYSAVAPQPVQTGHDVPIMVEAKVDAKGRVYDYSILNGPADPAVRLRVEQNLLDSVFQPATVFGVPVAGHIVMTYTGVSVRG